MEEAIWCVNSIFKFIADSLAGELVFLHGLGQNVLILNSQESISDLFEKRATIYSDRPKSVMVGELMGLHEVSG